MQEFVLILIKQIIKMPFSSLSLHLLFRLDKKPIFPSLRLADLSMTPHFIYLFNCNWVITRWQW